MRKLPLRQTAAELVYQAILDAVSDGRLAPGTHLVQEELAAQLGVSRQPVQQAMAMLKSDGIVEENGARGLHVAPINLATMRHRYAIRSALDALAASGAAETVRKGDRTIAEQGRRLVAEGRAAIGVLDMAKLVAADIGFHRYMYEASGNPLIAPTAEIHWHFLRRVMADVVRHTQPPVEIWDQHEGIVAAIAAGDAAEAARRAEAHVERATQRLSMTMERKE